MKCAYCDFNSYAELETEIPTWEHALLAELAGWAPVLGGRPVPTVFIGGGTPSLLEGTSVQRILDAARSQYEILPDAEITLEVNPESVDAVRLGAYREAGVNRLSIGVQSLQTEELHFLDRIHSANRAKEAFDIARNTGYGNVSTDLIFGLPGQSLSSWQATLDGVIGWSPDHISAYSLVVEEGTPLALRVDRGKVREADPDLVATMAEWTENHLAAEGYAQYEISNFAKPGHECEHNLVYWRHGQYLGLGPGAHGFVNGVRYAVEQSPLRYARVLRSPTPDQVPHTPAAVSAKAIDEATAAFDSFVMGMRLNAGIDTEELAIRYPDAWRGFAPALAWGAETRLIERDGVTLRLTKRGRRLANELFIRVFDPSLIED